MNIIRKIHSVYNNLLCELNKNTSKYDVKLRLDQNNEKEDDYKDYFVNLY